MAMRPDNSVHILHRHYSRSALFPSFNNLRLASIYFADQGPSHSYITTSNIVFSSGPLRDYNAVSLAIDDQFNLRAVFAEQIIDFQRNDTFGLRLATVHNWRAAVQVTSPVAMNMQVTPNDVMNVAWKTFNPIAGKSARVIMLDQQWNTIVVSDVLDADTDFQTAADLTQLAPGEYRLEVQLSAANFAPNYRRI